MQKKGLRRKMLKNSKNLKESDMQRVAKEIAIANSVIVAGIIQGIATLYMYIIIVFGFWVLDVITAFFVMKKEHIKYSSDKFKSGLYKLLFYNLLIISGLILEQQMPDILRPKIAGSVFFIAVIANEFYSIFFENFPKLGYCIDFGVVSKITNIFKKAKSTEIEEEEKKDKN